MIPVLILTIVTSACALVLGFVDKDLKAAAFLIWGINMAASAICISIEAGSYVERAKRREALPNPTEEKRDAS